MIEEMESDWQIERCPECGKDELEIFSNGVEYFGGCTCGYSINET